MKPFIILGVVVIFMLGVMVFIFSSSNAVPQASESLVAFAQCLADSGAKYFGAFWCPNCKNQTALLGGKGNEAIPYIECSTLDRQGQLPVCKQNGIEGYPTWDFADGTRLTGTQQLATLAEKTACPLPAE